MQKSKIGKNKIESKLTNIQDSIWPNNFQVYDVTPTRGCLDPSDRLIRLYRVSHSEECKVNQHWGVEGSIILLNYGA